jgi:hypothetical protein
MHTIFVENSPTRLMRLIVTLVDTGEKFDVDEGLFYDNLSEADQIKFVTYETDEFMLTADQVRFIIGNSMALR